MVARDDGGESGPGRCVDAYAHAERIAIIGCMDKGLRQHMIRRARQLRRDQTHPERVLWYALRSRRLESFKFRRQRPMGRYVVDFVCLEHMLIIELDGESHDEFNYAHDVQRQAWLESQGYRVLRISNDDILNDMENVILAILKALAPI